MYIPWNWLKKHIIFSESDKQQATAKNLTALGLETEIVGENWQFTPSPNRLDLFSWWGIAQEISILLNCPLNLSTASLNFNQNQETDWGKIKINADKCSQFQLILIQNVEIHSSPTWIKNYLASSNNIASINNIVDVANLVMLETGQPLHIYDYDRLSDQEIVIRNSLAGEVMTNLKGQLMTLKDEDIVISAGKEIISLAGIVGSQVASINNETTNILIESAFFDSSSIKKTSQRLNFSTQASQFFSKEYNLPFGDYALTRAIELIKEVCPKAAKKNIISWKKELSKAEKTILISHDFIEKKLGIELSSEKVEEILKKLRFSFQTK